MEQPGHRAGQKDHDRGVVGEVVRPERVRVRVGQRVSGGDNGERHGKPGDGGDAAPDSREALKVDDPAHQSSQFLVHGVAESAAPGGHTVRVEFDPPFPDLSALTDGVSWAGQ